MNARLNTAIFVLTASFFAGLLVANAQNPSQNPVNQIADSPISLTAQSGQAKLGGLTINNNGLTELGLWINGDSASRLGRLTIAEPGFTPPVGVSREQIEVQGNLRISGVIKSGSNSPTPFSALERTVSTLGEEMTWEGRGWITIMGAWSQDLSCTGASPRLCAAFGLREYGVHCFVNASKGYSVLARVCRE